MNNNVINTSAHNPLPPYTFAEELANTIIHVVGVVLSIIGLFFLIYHSEHNLDLVQKNTTTNLTRIISFSIYGVSLILMFLSSSLYHSTRDVALKKLFKLFDHCAIYLLIAGTYTPILILSIKGTLGYILMVIMWIIAFAGITFKVKTRDTKTPQKYKALSLSTYLSMGLVAIFLLEELFKILPIEALIYFISGGALYCIGVFFYVKKQIPFTHAIWHIFVLGAAACHYFMIYLYV